MLPSLTATFSRAAQRLAFTNAESVMLKHGKTANKLFLVRLFRETRTINIHYPCIILINFSFELPPYEIQFRVFFPLFEVTKYFFKPINFLSHQIQFRKTK